MLISSPRREPGSTTRVRSRPGLPAASLILSLGAALALPVSSQGQETRSAALQVIWSTPIIRELVPDPHVGKPYIPPREIGISLGQSVDRGGQITFLAMYSDYHSSYDVLLKDDFDLKGFQAMVRLHLRGTPTDSLSTLLARVFGTKENVYSRIPLIGSMTIDNAGMTWVGGAIDRYEGIAGPHGRAYLARLDGSAVPIWERSYKAGNSPFVVSMTPAANGDVLVAANYGWFGSSWLAMIAAGDGSVVWEQHSGNGAGIAVTPAPGDAFLVASFDATGTHNDYQENVAVRRVTAGGQMGSPSVVRPDINERSGAHYGAIRMSPTSDGAYVVSSWEVSFEQNPARLKPAEIAKVDTEGRLIWRTTIPTSFVVNTGRSGATFCHHPAVATLPNGDGLVACALKGQIYTHTFNRLTGDDTRINVPLPACNVGEYGGTLSLFVRPDGQILVSGTRPGGSAGPGCSWLARLRLPA